MKTMQKILLVDDDPNVLSAYQRRLRKRFDIETALCSEEGVTAVNFLGPFAVIVSDMQMPRENGAEFLAKIQKTSPDSVRIMLTGNADQQTAIDAVNQGGVFRFLNKPCPAEELEAAIQTGITEYERRIELRKSSAVNVDALVETLASVCSAFNPMVGLRQNRLKSSLNEYATPALRENQQLGTVLAIASQFGSGQVPPQLFAKFARGEELTPQESKQWSEQYVVAAEMIENVPHLTFVKEVLDQLGGAPRDDSEEQSEKQLEEVQLLAELLKASIQFDLSCFEAERETLQVLEEIKARGEYSETAKGLIEAWVAQRDQRRLIEVEVDSLVDGMKLVEEIATTSGTVLVPKGIEVSPLMRAKLQKYVASNQVQTTVKALIPMSQMEQAPAPLQPC